MVVDPSLLKQWKHWQRWPKSAISELLKFAKGFQQSEEYLFKKNCWISLSRVCGIATWTAPMSLCSGLQYPWKPAGLQPLDGQGLLGRLKKKKKAIPKALSLFDLLSNSLEKPCFIVVAWPDWSSELDLQENPVLRAFVKNNKWQLILSCWGVSSSCGNKNLTQNLKGRYENKISVKDFEKLLV